MSDPGRAARFAGRACAAAALALALLLSPLWAAGAHAQTDDDSGGGSGGGDNVALAINTKDGASVFRLAFAIRHVHGSVIDAGNAAVAYASCTDCQTVALAFQVILVTGEPDVVAPTNLALAYNESCSSCVTFAAATQILVDTDGRMVRFTKEGRKRLAALRKHLRSLRDETPTIEGLEAELAAARAELADILANHLVPVGDPRDDADDDDDDVDSAEDADSGSDDGSGGSSSTTSPSASGGGTSTSTTSTTVRTTTSTAPTSTTAP